MLNLDIENSGKFTEADIPLHRKKSDPNDGSMKFDWGVWIASERTAKLSSVGTLKSVDRIKLGCDERGIRSLTCPDNKTENINEELALASGCTVGGDVGSAVGASEGAMVGVDKIV